ncbi:hypothetical protein Tco_0055064, partial [Tanacetum coccineum]
MFVDLESFTQADGAQSSRVPVPLLEDPYEAIRQDYLDGTDNESEPFEDPIDTETPELPFTDRAYMAEVAAMYESTSRKWFRSSYESSPSMSPPDLPSRKRYRGTSGLVEDSEEDDDEEDEEIEESLDSDSVSEDAEDEGLTAEDEDPATGDEGLAAGVEGLGMDDEIHRLDDESRGLDKEGHSVESDGLGLEEEVEAVLEALEEDHVYSTFEVGQGSRFVPESERPERVSASRLPTLTTWTNPEDGMVYVDILAYPPLAPPV